MGWISPEALRIYFIHLRIGIYHGRTQHPKHFFFRGNAFANVSKLNFYPAGYREGRGERGEWGALEIYHV